MMYVKEGWKIKKQVVIEEKEITISNPDKVLFPQESYTKWEYMLHMTRLAPYIVPYCRNRYLTTIRYPDGITGKSFYQKNIPSHAPDWVSSATDGKIRYVLLQDTATLVWLANLACLEFHTSFDRADNPRRPTELVFDIDPSVDDFDRVIEVALVTRQLLLELQLDGVVKTSGATGLQIYVPIKPRYSFEETRKVNEFIAHYLSSKYPKLITLERMVNKRGEKVYFDYLQHWGGKTLTAPYSPRARPGAPVSTPLLWEELVPGLTPTQFTLETIHGRIDRLGDLFAPISSPEKSYSLDEILLFIKGKGG